MCVLTMRLSRHTRTHAYTHVCAAPHAHEDRNQAHHDAAAVPTPPCCRPSGSNYRLPQPLNGRVLRVWRDVDNSKKGYLPEDAATAASAGTGARA